ncbi:MAG: HEAT repeat domain-containing protein [Planctomycetota bacterium]|nr:HEAT repeat domain-containing protein [Planctomycetota bacterium]
MTRIPVSKTLRGVVVGGIASVVALLSVWAVALCADEADRKPLPEPFVRGEMKRQDFGSDRTVRLLAELVENGIDPLEREKAVTDLGRTRNPAALAHLERALSDNDRCVRSAAALALCNFTSAEAVGLLTKALERTDSSGDDLEGALRAAREVRWQGLSVALVKLLDHSAGAVRAEALNALTDLSKSADAETLRKLLSDDNISVRLAAARNAALAEPDAILAEALSKPARSDAPAVRGLCLSALGRHAPKKYIQLLIDGGNDKNPFIRRGAVEGLTSAGEAEKVGAFLNDDSTPVRLAAVRGVGKLKRTESIDRIFEIMLQAPPDETHLAARDALIQMNAPETVSARAGTFMKENSTDYFELLESHKKPIPPDEVSQLARRIEKARRNLKALSYLLGSAKSTRDYEAHLGLLIRMDFKDPVLEQLALSMGRIGDRRAVGPIMKQLTACADFSEKALKSMFLNPLNPIPLPEDNSAALLHAAVALKISEALPVLIRFSSMGFGQFRAKRSAWTADMLMPEMTDEQTRPAVVEELQRQLSWKYAAGDHEKGSDEYDKAQSRRFTVLRCRFESAKSLGKLKADEAVDNLRWILTEDRPDMRVMQAAAWAIQEITGKTPHVGLPQPRPGDWIIKDY